MTQPSLQQQRVWLPWAGALLRGPTGDGRPAHRPACLAITAVHISTPRPKGGQLTRSSAPLPINQLSRKPSQLQSHCSGIVESGNKLVVEQRRKWAGMHWSHHNVNPMLALHAVVCNGAWKAEWPGIWQHLCGQAQARVTQGRHRRQEAQRALAPQAASPPLPQRVLLSKPPMLRHDRPTEHHPWRQGYD